MTMGKLEQAKTGPLVRRRGAGGHSGGRERLVAMPSPPNPHRTPPRPQRLRNPRPAAAPEAKDDHAAPAGDHAAPAAHAAARARPAGASTASRTARASGSPSHASPTSRSSRASSTGSVASRIADHLAARGAQIRKDLVDAAEMRSTATARLAEIESKLAALPGELEQMRARSAEELEAERTRIRAAAETERDRLVEQARREIASQTRNARAQLRAHAAALAVDVADARLRSTLTPAEQSALVDQYAQPDEERAMTSLDAKRAGRALFQATQAARRSARHARQPGAVRGVARRARRPPRRADVAVRACRPQDRRRHAGHRAPRYRAGGPSDAGDPGAAAPAGRPDRASSRN